MSQIKITLLIDIPEDARVSTPDVDYVEPPHIAAAPSRLPPFPGREVTEELPRVQPRCANHGESMRRFPAGTNKAGKPYNASWRCSVADCTVKPIWDRDAA